MVGAPCRWFAPPHRGSWGHGGLWGWHLSLLLYPMGKGQVAPGGVHPGGCHCTPGLPGPVDASPASHKLLCLCFFFFFYPTPVPSISPCCPASARCGDPVLWWRFGYQPAVLALSQAGLSSVQQQQLSKSEGEGGE